MFSRIPPENLNWRSHPKNWTLGELAIHLAEIPGWIDSVLNYAELDFATINFQPPLVETPEDILLSYENALILAKSALVDAAESKLNELWTLRTADKILMSSSKKGIVRHCLSQQIHHRA